MNQTSATNSTTKRKIYHVKASELPISCPTKDMDTALSHPRVFLNLSKTGQAVCQYCSTQFVLDK